MKDFKSFNKALVPSKEVGITPAYNGLKIQNAVSIGSLGGFAFDPKSKLQNGYIRSTRPSMTFWGTVWCLPIIFIVFSEYIFNSMLGFIADFKHVFPWCG